MKLRILVADDHELIRQGLVALINAQPDLELVAAVPDGQRAFEQIEALLPEVAVLDITMPGLTGIEVARRVRDAGLRTAVVILSVQSEPAYVRAALDAGASGYLLKEGAAQELVTAVRAVAAGDAYLCSKVARIVTDSMRTPEPTPAAALTVAQCGVLRLLARGLSSKEIAAALELSTRTVDFHRSTLMERLGIHHVPGLVKYALRHQLTTLDD